MYESRQDFRNPLVARAESLDDFRYTSGSLFRLEQSTSGCQQQHDGHGYCKPQAGSKNHGRVDEHECDVPLDHQAIAFAFKPCGLSRNCDRIDQPPCERQVVKEQAAAPVDADFLKRLLSRMCVSRIMAPTVLLAKSNGRVNREGHSSQRPQPRPNVLYLWPILPRC